MEAKYVWQEFLLTYQEFASGIIELIRNIPEGFHKQVKYLSFMILWKIFEKFLKDGVDSWRINHHGKIEKREKQGAFNDAASHLPLHTKFHSNFFIFPHSNLNTFAACDD
jgi:hypothetical protein